MTTVIDLEARATQHCETSALGVLLRHQGLDLSEPMLFGLGSGLSFIYLVDTDQQGGTVTTSLTSLARARVARGPMTAKHRTRPCERRAAWQPLAALAAPVPDQPFLKTER